MGVADEHWYRQFPAARGARLESDNRRHLILVLRAGKFQFQDIALLPAQELFAQRGLRCNHQYLPFFMQHLRAPRRGPMK